MTNSSQATTPKPFVFVLMPFDPQFADIYKFGIKGAAEDVGAYAERLDEQLFGEGMLDRIFNQISKADVIVADMSGRTPNVFYEVGYAHALGKVVLLLTQKAGDIPFDLKHRQHTVYGGRIETLRAELAERLRWGIAESRRQSRGAIAERLSVRILGTEIPRTLANNSLPTIGGKVALRSFRLPVQIRNDSYEAITGITHVYLFAEDSATLAPCRFEMQTYEWDSNSHLFSLSSIGSPRVLTHDVAVPLESFTATAMDAPDGLAKQFRLPITVSNLPPGAVEATAINLLLADESTKCDAKFRLRLHSTSQIHDHSFRLAVEYVPESKAPTGKGKADKSSHASESQAKAASDESQ
jgi:hypothetical protein